MSGSFQARPGIAIGSNYSFTGPQAGVVITGGGTQTVTVVDPTTQFYSYVKNNDIRVARTFKVSRTRVQPFMEIVNLANLSTILTVNENVGPNYIPRRRPSSRAADSSWARRIGIGN